VNLKFFLLLQESCRKFSFSVVESLEGIQNRAIASFLSAIAVCGLLNLKQLTEFRMS